MRVLAWLGIGCIATAYAIGAIHFAFTGDSSITQLVVHGVVAACVMSLIVVLRLGLPSQIRAYTLKRALRQRSPRA